MKKKKISFKHFSPRYRGKHEVTDFAYGTKCSMGKFSIEKIIQSYGFSYFHWALSHATHMCTHVLTMKY